MSHSQAKHHVTAFDLGSYNQYIKSCKLRPSQLGISVIQADYFKVIFPLSEQDRFVPQPFSPSFHDLLVLNTVPWLSQGDTAAASLGGLACPLAVFLALPCKSTGPWKEFTALLDSR